MHACSPCRGCTKHGHWPHCTAQITNREAHMQASPSPCLLPDMQAQAVAARPSDMETLARTSPRLQLKRVQKQQLRQKGSTQLLQDVLMHVGALHQQLDLSTQIAAGLHSQLRSSESSRQCVESELTACKQQVSRGAAAACKDACMHACVAQHAQQHVQAGACCLNGCACVQVTELQDACQLLEFSVHACQAHTADLQQACLQSQLEQAAAQRRLEASQQALHATLQRMQQLHAKLWDSKHELRATKDSLECLQVELHASQRNEQELCRQLGAVQSQGRQCRMLEAEQAVAVAMRPVLYL